VAREFNLSTGAAGVAATSVTLLYLRAPAGPSVNIEILRWWASQSGSTTSLQCRIDIAQRGSAFPVLVTLTPVTLKMQDPTASLLLGSTTGAAATSGATASSEPATSTYPQLLIEDAFNVLNGWLHVPTPPETIINPAGSLTGISLRFPVNSALVTWSYGCNFREI
jgi:hypothetical protein